MPTEVNQLHIHPAPAEQLDRKYAATTSTGASYIGLG